MTDPRDRAPDEPLEPIDEEPLDGEPLDDADVDAVEDELLDAAEADGADAEAAVDDYDAAIREVAGEDVPEAGTTAERPRSAQRRSTTKTTARAPSPSEIAVHVREDWSKAFVIASVAVFVAILLNGLLLGTGGLLRPIATPSPIPTESPSASPTGDASPSPSASASVSPAPSASPS